MRRTRRLAATAAAIPLLLGWMAGSAIADDISNNLDATVDATAETMTLNVGGGIKTTDLYVRNTNGDGKNGCNLTGGTSLGLDVTSSDAAVATVSPGSLTFTSCGEVKTLTVTPVGLGTTTISVHQTSNTTGGTFNLAPATFTVNVAPPANTAPQIAVEGVTVGASYAKGAVPAATCRVTDAEDGSKTFPAMLSAVTGPHALDGIGEQTADCSYTDKGGLKAEASAVYSIVDLSAPSITPVLTPATPDGNDGWYTGDVSLTWQVEESESPSSLELTGCEPQNVTADQAATDYTCAATSAGGAADQTVSIKRDATAPVVALGEVSGTQGQNGWYTSDVTGTFTATDATSGPSSASQTATTSGEGEVVLTSPAFSDVAGNTTPAGAVTKTYKVDKTAPATPTFVGGPTGDYYFGQDPAAPTCTADDDVSGLASCVVTGGGTSVGTHTYTATATDNAGHTSTAEFAYQVLPWNLKGFTSPVNMGGVWNTVKGGSTVPLKFEAFAGAAELTSTAAVKGFTVKAVTCPGSSAPADEIEFVTTGGTSLRYDTTAGQFVQNWQTPKKAGTCYAVTMTTQDGSAITANFQLK